MNGFRNLAAILAVVLVVGCATHVAITPTHRENMAAQAKVLAIAARDLEEDTARQHHAAGAEEQAAEAVIKFHAEAENFAGTTVAWQSDDRVGSDYERLIQAWVEVKQTFSNLNSDKVTQDSYSRTQHEWEKLERTSGYSGRKYEQRIEQEK